MEFSRQRKPECVINKSKKTSFLVKSNVSWVVRVISTLLTIFMWIYTYIIIYMLLSGLFNENDPYIGIVKTALKITNQDIQSFFLVSAIWIGIIFSLLYIWRTYNKQRFGKLKRRKMPLVTSDEEMVNLKLVDKDDYENLQQHKVIVFEKNPVKDLINEKKK
ncbi:MAG TPA: poly-beta-1,6-N-acetyl-D-glucosamine biosynthesis protein PgaD [Firmicutes bacterium]|nr:poly-beta-1,6-N-acetyl-D-glucosamine biosynthesis protein PgaD [Bacillota bacterium]